WRRGFSLMRALLPVAASLLLAGCSLAPPHVAPAPPVPGSWPVGDAYLVQSEAALASIDYTDVFGDPRFLRLAEQALANNRDLRIAAANLEAARARARAIRSEQFPLIGVSGSADYSTGGKIGRASCRERV